MPAVCGEGEEGNGNMMSDENRVRVFLASVIVLFVFLIVLWGR